MSELTIETLYRYVEDHRYEGYDDEYTHTELKLLTYKVVKTTPCGVWIERDHFYAYLDARAFGYRYDRRPRPRKWVQTTPGRKRFAHTEKSIALEAFIIRKEFHLWHAEHRLKLVKAALAAGESLKEAEGTDAEKV